jgi:hypothetical protein
MPRLSCIWLDVTIEMPLNSRGNVNLALDLCLSAIFQTHVPSYSVPDLANPGIGFSEAEFTASMACSF